LLLRYIPLQGLAPGKILKHRKINREAKALPSSEPDSSSLRRGIL
jgi:hypothetical protein